MENLFINADTILHKYCSKHTVSKSNSLLLTNTVC